MQTSVLSPSTGSLRSLTLLSGSHHHSSTDGVKGVGSDTGTGGDTPSEEERGQEGSLEASSEDDGLQRIVETKVETTVDDDTDDRWDETTVETGNTVGSQGLLVDVEETVELALTASLLGGLVVVGETGSGVVERVDEEERRSTGGTTRGQVTGELAVVAIGLLSTEQGPGKGRKRGRSQYKKLQNSDTRSQHT